jgi:hypothetical protein
MKPEDLQLMHEVLDGEASADDARLLDRLLAADPAARAEYEELQRLFEGLNATRAGALPEGLLAGVLAQMPRRHTRRHRLRQLSSRWRVLLSDSNRLRDKTPNRMARTPRDFQGEHNIRNAVMSGQTSKRKLWIGGGIAVAALIIASRYLDFPPSQDMSGTIAPAHRSVAEQPGAGDVTGAAAGQAGSPSPEAAATADAARDSARDASRDAAKDAAAAKDASRDAAKDAAAARDASRDAAKDAAAAKDASRDASRDAAKDASRDAAKDAAKDAAAARDAAKDAAKDAAAARDAAKDASRDAAKDASRDAAKDAAKSDSARSN